MKIMRVSEAPSHKVHGLESYQLINPKTVGSKDLIVTWVRVSPNGAQRPHRHPNQEQMFYIIQGEGLMTVEGEEAAVKAGMAIYIPQNAEHAIVNTSSADLIYVSATTPFFDMDKMYAEWKKQQPSKESKRK